MARKPKAGPKRGDLVEVVWLDICEHPTGDPREAQLARRTSYGLLWEQRQDQGVEAVITTTTLDDNGPEQQGWCIYPSGCIVSLKVIKRAKAA